MSEDVDLRCYIFFKGLAGAKTTVNVVPANDSAVQAENKNK